MKAKILVTSVFLLSGLAAFGQAAAAAAITNPPPANPWDASAAVGLTLTSGNSKTLLVSGNIAAAKKWSQDELGLGVDGVYGENDSVKNTEALHGFAQFNHLFTERFFGYVRVDGLHDGIAGIEYRLAASGGVGYYFVKTLKTTLRGEIGPGYVYEKDDATATSPSTTHSYMTLRLAERFDQKLSDSAKLWESVEFLPQVDRFSNYIVNAEIGIESAMSKKLSLQALLQDTYHSEPVPGRLKNDLKLIAGVKYKF